jgi:hypothetical protein
MRVRGVFSGGRELEGPATNKTFEGQKPPRGIMAPAVGYATSTKATVGRRDDATSDVRADYCAFKAPPSRRRVGPPT